jgi:hypothetical protein
MLFTNFRGSSYLILEEADSHNLLKKDIKEISFQGYLTKKCPVHYRILLYLLQINAGHLLFISMNDKAKSENVPEK